MFSKNRGVMAFEVWRNFDLLGLIPQQIPLISFPLRIKSFVLYCAKVFEVQYNEGRNRENVERLLRLES